MDTNESSVVGPPSEPLGPARAPHERLPVGWSGPERALGAALASDPNGEGELAMRVTGVSVKGGRVKSPRLALERLQ
jgi:hypothetical protein